MKGAVRLILALCFIAILISSAPWIWKVSAGLLLALAYRLASRITDSPVNSGVVRIFKDDTSMLSTRSEKRVFASLAEHQWMSPWFCSIAVHPARGGRRRYLVVCAAGNDADEYRRLLKYLRMRTSASGAERMIW